MDISLQIWMRHSQPLGEPAQTFVVAPFPDPIGRDAVVQVARRCQHAAVLAYQVTVLRAFPAHPLRTGFTFRPARAEGFHPGLSRLLAREKSYPTR